MSSIFSKAAGTTVDVTFGDKNAEKKHSMAYWSIRGLGAPPTMMLCAAKEPFTLYLYDLVEKGEDGWSSDYFAAKGGYIKEFKQPLWNLPFCVDNENNRVICQTNAVFSHLGKVCGMFGDDENSASECEQLLAEIYDLRDVMITFVYKPNPENPADVLKNASTYFQKFESWLEIQGEKSKDEDASVVHLVNGKFSAPDFHLFEMVDQFEALAKQESVDLYEKFPKLKEFKEGFASLPENKFYLDSWLHKELPFNNVVGRFGGLPGPKAYTHTVSAKEATWRGKGLVELSP